MCATRLPSRGRVPIPPSGLPVDACEAENAGDHEGARQGTEASGIRICILIYETFARPILYLPLSESLSLSL